MQLQSYNMAMCTLISYYRYSLLKDSIEVYVVDFVKDQLIRKQGMDTPRNLLRVLTATCGFPEVRQLATPRLEMWLQNPKVW